MEFVLRDVQGVDLKGLINFILRPGVYKIPPIKESDGAWIVKALQDGDLWSVDSPQKIEDFARDMVTLSRYFAPRRLPNSPASLVFTWNLTLSFLMDDLLESKDYYGQGNKELSTTTIGDIIKGKYKSEEDLPQVAPELHKLYIAQLRAAKDANEVIPGFFQNSTYFADAYTRTFSAIKILEQERYELKECQLTRLPKETYRYLRRQDSAVEAFLELSFLCSCAIPSPTLRNDLYFRRILEVATSAVAHSNDLFGLRRDINSRLGYNLVVYKANFGSLEEAFSQVLEICNSDVAEIIAISQRMRVMHGGEEDMDTILSIIEHYVDGHIYWYMKNTRYGKNQTKLVEDKEMHLPERGNTIPNGKNINNML